MAIKVYGQFHESDIESHSEIRPSTEVGRAESFNTASEAEILPTPSLRSDINIFSVCSDDFDDNINVFSSSYDSMSVYGVGSETIQAHVNIHSSSYDSIGVYGRGGQPLQAHINIYSHALDSLDANVNVYSFGAYLFDDALNVFSAGHADINVRYDNFAHLTVFSAGHADINVRYDNFAHLTVFSSGYADLSIYSVGSKTSGSQGTIPSEMPIVSKAPDDISAVYFANNLNLFTEGRDPYSESGTLTIYTPNDPVKMSGTLTIVANPVYRIYFDSSIPLVSMATEHGDFKGALPISINTFAMGFYSDFVFVEPISYFGEESGELTVFSPDSV